MIDYNCVFGGGITHGTICEYKPDGWTWVGVLGVDTDRSVHFVNLDELNDSRIKEFETAVGCAEHGELIESAYFETDTAYYVDSVETFLEKFEARGPMYDEYQTADSEVSAKQ